MIRKTIHLDKNFNSVNPKLDNAIFSFEIILTRGKGKPLLLVELDSIIDSVELTILEVNEILKNDYRARVIKSDIYNYRTILINGNSKHFISNKHLQEYLFLIMLSPNLKKSIHNKLHKCFSKIKLKPLNIWAECLEELLQEQYLLARGSR